MQNLQLVFVAGQLILIGIYFYRRKWLGLKNTSRRFDIFLALSFACVTVGLILRRLPSDFDQAVNLFSVFSLGGILSSAFNDSAEMKKG